PARLPVPLLRWPPRPPRPTLFPYTTLFRSHGRLQELRDWQGFVTQPKQIELCERMEYLAEQSLDPQLKANRIKELQTEWRALGRSEEHTSELQSRENLVCRLLLEKKKKQKH